MSNSGQPGTITSLSSRAADAFASEGFVGGVGIVGLILIVIAAGILGTGAPQATFADPTFLLAVGLFILAMYVLFIAGFLFILRRLVKREITVRMIDSYTSIALELSTKVKDNTVDSQEIGRLTEDVLEYLGRLLASAM